jgi:hypothetical protein
LLKGSGYFFGIWRGEDKWKFSPFLSISVIAVRSNEQFFSLLLSLMLFSIPAKAWSESEGFNCSLTRWFLN